MNSPKEEASKQGSGELKAPRDLLDLCVFSSQPVDEDDPGFCLHESFLKPARASLGSLRRIGEMINAALAERGERPALSSGILELPEMQVVSDTAVEHHLGILLRDSRADMQAWANERNWKIADPGAVAIAGAFHRLEGNNLFEGRHIRTAGGVTLTDSPDGIVCLTTSNGKDLHPEICTAFEVAKYCCDEESGKLIPGTLFSNT